MIMTAFMEEMKQQSQSILENLRERGKPRLEVASKPKRQISNKLREQHSKNLREAGEFHNSPMHVEVKYLHPHRKENDTLANVAGEMPNATRATTPQRIFTQTNPLTQPRAYERGFSFNGGPGGHHVTCKSKWQRGAASSTSFSGTFWATNSSTRFRSNQRGSIGVIWARP